MARTLASSFVALTTATLFTMAAAGDFTTSYCSTQNTASTNPFYWVWQSNGKCTDYCNSAGTYAFAVIQYTNCWCSNYIPAAQQDTSGCMVGCPGFPDEKCGDKDKGLFIYIKLAGSPSGTQGGSQPTSVVPAPVPPTQIVTSIVSADPETVIQTVPGEVATKTVYNSITSVIVSTFTSTTSIKSLTTLKISTTTTPTATATAPMTVPTVVTESGVVITRTVVLMPSSAPVNTESPSGGSNTGAIVGGVVGGLLGFLAIVGGILFFLWRRRKQHREEQEQVGGLSGITRNTSTMSKAGLLGHSAEKDIQRPAPIATNFSTQRSRQDNESISPITASDRRYSQPLIIDSRLDPRAVLTFHGANASRESVGSIDDSRDYGRQLNVRNPDLEHRE